MDDFAGNWRARTRLRFCRLRRKMRARARAGSAAVEFAFVAPIFLLFLMGTIEVGVMFFADFTLQNATVDASRLIRTGQVQQASMQASDFRTQVCNEIKMLLSCDAGTLQIDVETYPTFAAANYTNPLLANQTLDPALQNFNTGAECSIEMVRVFYKWKVFTPLLDTFMINMAGNYHLISATVAFRNEPYSTQVAGC